jgi:hypothetical protein
MMLLGGLMPMIQINKMLTHQLIQEPTGTELLVLVENLDVAEDVGEWVVKLVSAVFANVCKQVGCFDVSYLLFLMKYY